MAVGRLGRFNTITLPNVAAGIPSSSNRQHPSENNRTDTVIDNKEENNGAPGVANSQLPDLTPADPPSQTSVTKNGNNIPMIACQITSTFDDR